MQKLLNLVNEEGIITQKFDMYINEEPTSKIQFTIYFPSLEILEEYIVDELNDDILEILTSLNFKIIKQIHIETNVHQNCFIRVFSFIEVLTDEIPLSIDEDQLELMRDVQVKREPFESPRLIINPEIKSLEDLESWASTDDFKVEGYKCHESIKYPFSV